MPIRRVACLVTALAALAIVTGPAWSARVVEVRVGNHPSYTRVVFELDAPAGYRIERREAADGQEIVVKLSAASAPRTVKSRSAMVAGVALEPSGAESIAHIRLRGKSPRVKELILGGPPRIVLDIVLPEEKPVRDAAAPPVVAPKSADVAPKPKLATKPEPSKVTTRPKPPTVAEAPEPPKPTAKPEPPKVVETAQPPGEPPKVAAPPMSKPADRPIAKVEEALEGERIVLPKPGPSDAPGTAEVASPAPAPAPGEPEAQAPMSARKPPTATPPKVVAKAPSAPGRPAEAKGPFGLDFDDSDTWRSLGLVGAGLVVFLLVVAMLLRRHSKPTSLDALEVAREPGASTESGDIFETIASVGTKATTPSFPVAGPGLFDDEREKGESEMDVSAELPIERGARGAPFGASMGSDAGLGSLVQELERRMAQLESRLDAANEARERLERQVTAQSEELRVQRAAIARTQRAVRGMTRGGDDQATEPALRDPAKPTTGRS